MEFLLENNIDVEKGIELLGDIETYNEIVDEFLLEVDEKLNKIKYYKTNQDFNNYSILIHSLKSDVKYFGITDLADILFQHETMSKNNDINYINENFEQLILEINKYINILKKYRMN